MNKKNNANESDLNVRDDLFFAKERYDSIVWFYLKEFEECGLDETYEFVYDDGVRFSVKEFSELMAYIDFFGGYADSFKYFESIELLSKFIKELFISSEKEMKDGKYSKELRPMNIEDWLDFQDSMFYQYNVEV